MSSVSVIVPCYNYGRFLAQCLGSVLTQDGPEVEVLIIDDASSDETSEVGDALARADGRVEFRRHDRNRGHIATYNEGLAWARGDYTVLLSADDLLAGGALARAVRLMDEFPDVGMTYGRVIRFESEIPQVLMQSPAGVRVLSGREWMRRRCRAGETCIASPEAIVRTELQRRLGGYREDLPHSADMEMWMRFAVHGPLGYVDGVQAYVREHQGSMRHQRFVSPLDRLRQRRAAFEAVFEDPGDLDSEMDHLRALANRALAREALWSVLQLIHRGQVDAQRVRDLLTFAVDTYAPDASDGTDASLGRRIWAMASLVGPFLDGLSRWPRSWVSSQLHAWRAGQVAAGRYDS